MNITGKRITFGTTKINDKEYYNVKQFAALTNRTQQSVRFLISKGNKIRKLKYIKIVGAILIPINELTNYPFTTCGRNFEVYHYNKDGSIVGTDL